MNRFARSPTFGEARLLEAVQPLQGRQRLGPGKARQRVGKGRRRRNGTRQGGGTRVLI